MISVIILGHGSKDEVTNAAVGRWSAAQGTELLLIAKNRPAQSPCKFVPTGQSKMSACIALALGMATGESVLLVDARASWREDSVSALLADVDGHSDLTIFPVHNGAEKLSLESTSPEAVLHALSNGLTLPVAALGMSAALLPKEELPDSSSAGDTLAYLIATTVASAEETQISTISFQAPDEVCAISESGRIQALSALIAATNIEQLYPRHDWLGHSEESAAASYHSLAALFIRFGDRDSAEECLRLSDKLEESPRSLALKGIIAADRGEILGAVANMVSSLQKYEIRKRENDIHYARFQPTDLERINENLNAGLQALNKRDNERALSHFTTAVFSFDPFYGELGVAKGRS